MIYAKTKQEVEPTRKAFVPKRRVKCRAVADSLEEAGDKQFASRASRKANGSRSEPRPPSGGRTRNSKRRIKTQTVPPYAETAAMLFRASLASGEIAMRKVDGWECLGGSPFDQIFDLAA